MVGVSFINQDFYDELASKGCNYLTKYLVRIFLVLFHTITSMTMHFIIFPLYAASFLCERNYGKALGGGGREMPHRLTGKDAAC